MFERIDDIRNIPNLDESKFSTLMEDLAEFIDEQESDIDSDDEDTEEGITQTTQTTINKLRTHMSYLEDEYNYDPKSTDTQNEIEKIVSLLGGDNE